MAKGEDTDRSHQWVKLGVAVLLGFVLKGRLGGTSHSAQYGSTTRPAPSKVLVSDPASQQRIGVT